MKIIRYFIALTVVTMSCAPIQNETWITSNGQIKTIHSHEVGESISSFINLLGEDNEDSSEERLENLKIDTSVYISDQMPSEF